MAKGQLRTSENTSVNVEEVLSEDEWYPLLPVEKKLISITLGLGIIFMLVFVIAFKVL